MTSNFIYDCRGRHRKDTKDLWKLKNGNYPWGGSHFFYSPMKQGIIDGLLIIRKITLRISHVSFPFPTPCIWWTGSAWNRLACWNKSLPNRRLYMFLEQIYSCSSNAWLFRLRLNTSYFSKTAGHYLRSRFLWFPIQGLSLVHLRK